MFVPIVDVLNAVSSSVQIKNSGKRKKSKRSVVADGDAKLDYQEVFLHDQESHVHGTSDERLLCKTLYDEVSDMAGSRRATALFSELME